MSLLRAVATVGGYTMISRVTGFARDVLIASILGAGPVADAFFVAFKLPNFFRRITAEGAFTIAFVPLFSKILQKEGRCSAMTFAEEALALLAAILLTFSVAAIVSMPVLMLLIAPGFAETPWRFNLSIELTRTTFVYLPLISLVALLGGILNSIGKFAAMASAPILLNLVLISSLAFFADAMQTPGHVLAVAVAISGFAQAAWLFEACRRANALPKFRLPRMTPRMKELMHLMLPAILGAGVVQINLLVDIILASTLPTGSVSFLYYADRINQLPLGVIGIAIGTALLPRLSKYIQAEENEAARQSQDKALEIGMLLTFPATIGLLVLSDPIVTLLFYRGAFSLESVGATSLALVFYSTGLPAFMAIKVLQPSFFARHDTATPVKIAGAMVLVNLALNLLLMPHFAHVGLAMATAISAWFNAVLLCLTLKNKQFHSVGQTTWRKIGLIIIASLVMGLGLSGLQEFFPVFALGTGLIAASVLVFLITIGFFIYAVSILLFRVVRPMNIRKELKSWFH
ncbi:MAG: murein biosynthesis integral membrane protein MurJ [Rhodospirillaceae bacterium]|nr:murein biosynthesis integral membrane protein MurJ [Rhodospirillaceae bacterium]|tara:strand:- start:623 stop:2173 length:1551 start_codon:yes stop_codon:yes gene_type:complete